MYSFYLNVRTFILKMYFLTDFTDTRKYRFLGLVLCFTLRCRVSMFAYLRQYFFLSFAYMYVIILVHMRNMRWKWFYLTVTISFKALQINNFFLEIRMTETIKNTSDLSLMQSGTLFIYLFVCMSVSWDLGNP